MPSLSERIMAHPATQAGDTLVPGQLANVFKVPVKAVRSALVSLEDQGMLVRTHSHMATPQFRISTAVSSKRVLITRPWTKGIWEEHETL